jgi:hypothetical protein
MTISGYEWMLFITAASLCASVGVAGTSSALVEKLRRLCAVRRSDTAFPPAACTAARAA